MTRPDPHFYTKTDYFTDLGRRIDAAGTGSRILLMTMDFEPAQPIIADLLHKLDAAAGRSADVTLAVDAHSFLASGSLPGPLWYRRELPNKLHEPYKLQRDWLRRIGRHASARTVILNKPAKRFSLPIAGRSHIKAAIVDDYYYLGGCNLDQPSHVDLMLGRNDPVAADQLYRKLRQITDSGSARLALGGSDQTIELGRDERIFIDAGVAGKSRIMEQALQSIDAAQDWLLFTCQFFPNSVTARHLLAAVQRGVRTSVVFTHPRRHNPLGAAGQYLNRTIERSRLPAALFSNQLPADGPFLHAKIIASDQGLLIGSHNYVMPGVQFGTAEIALQTSSPDMARQAASAIYAQLPASMQQRLQ